MTDTVALGHSKHNVHGLIQVDVTDARRSLADRRPPLSFTAYVIAAFSTAVAAERRVQAYRDWRGRLVVFDDVDVLTLVERETEDEPLPVPHVVRAANCKTVEDIHEEIRSVQAQRSRGLGEFAAGPWATRVFLGLPGALRRGIMRAGMRVPTLWCRYGGTTVVSAVGMFGQGRPGWGIPLATHTTCLTVGSVAAKPWVVEGEVVPREILHLTLSFDHDVVDGAPAARFAARLGHELESGACLER